MRRATERTLTGWHVLAIIIAFFAVVIGANLTLAVFAHTSWTGLVEKGQGRPAKP
jgi:nitrogen fixation protein FixH